MAKDILKLSGERQDKAEDIFRLLETGQRHSTTHPLNRLKGWDSTKIDSRHIVIHQNRDKGLFVGYVGGQHDYEAARRRLGSLDLVAYFGGEDDEEESGPYCSHCDQDGHDESDMHTTCRLCGGGKDAEGAHMGTEDGKCEYSPKKTTEEREDEAYDKLDPSKYCGEGCRSGHASDIAHGVGFHHTFNIDEHDDWHKPRPDARPVPPGSSSPHAEPFARQRSGYEVRNPDDFGLCHYCRAPLKGGLADQMKSLKQAIKAPHWERDHDWLPGGRIFSGGKGHLDPRVFNEQTRIMLPEVAKDTLDDVDSVLGKYGEWKNWARVYLAGSQASEWWGNNDFDCLIGINHSRIRREVPEFKDLTPAEIDKHLTNELKSALNDEDYHPPWDTDVWHRTFYCNPNSWDIRDIKPYAAYEIISKQWFVEPIHAGPDWSALKLPESLFDEGEALVKQIDAIEKSSDATGRGASLWDYLHKDRGRAFSAEGSGVFDPGNAVWKYLDMHPGEPLTRLLNLKRQALEDK